MAEPTLVAPPPGSEKKLGNEFVVALIARIDHMLERTKERQVFTCNEVQDFCLDLRSAVMEETVSEN